MSSRLEKLQRAIADKIERTQIFRGARVVLEKPTSVEGKIEEKLYNDLGVNIIVKFPIPTFGTSTASTVVFSEVLVKVRVLENIPTNTLGRGAMELGEQILKGLCSWTPPSDGASHPLSLRNEYPYYTLAGSATTNVVELRFTTSLSL